MHTEQGCRSEVWGRTAPSIHNPSPPHSCTPVVEPLEGERGKNAFLSKSFHVSHPANVSRSALSFEIIAVFEISTETRRVRRFDRKQ